MSLENYFTVTFTTAKGSHQFELHRLVRSVVSWIGVGTILVLVLLTALVKALFEDTKEQGERQNDLYQRLHKVAVENSGLNDQLKMARNGINEMERLLDLEIRDDAPLDERVDRVYNRFDQKENEYSYIRQSIINVERILGLSPTANRDTGGSRKLRIDYAAITATHKRYLFDNIPNDVPFRYKNDRLSLEDKITSEFGYRLHPIKKQRQFHHGIDFGLPLATSIIAPANGIVEDEGYSKSFGYYIALRHNFGFSTRYGHLQSRSSMRRGDVISKGDVIGYVGNTGISTGSHLHYELSYLGKSLDPYPFVKWKIADTNYSIFKETSDIQWQPILEMIGVWIEMHEQVAHRTPR